ncbi:MAG: class C sortase [Atopobiaceae bacterium]|nr:class C sortase [Atopobiaceae bacterium]
MPGRRKHARAFSRAAEALPSAARFARPSQNARLLRLLPAIALVLAGVALLLYPHASSWLNQMEQDEVARIQQEAVSKAPEEDLSAEMAAARDYNARLAEGRVIVSDPFDPDAPRTTGDEYGALLNLADDGVMAQLVIPCIEVNLPVYHGVEGEGMAHGTGHMPSTSLPVGGPSTHSVIAGHTGLPSAKIFDRLEELSEGDLFVIRVLGEDHAYRVSSTETVLPDETESLAITEGEDLVTLVTCTPYGANTHRLLVHAERTELPEGWGEEELALGGEVAKTLLDLRAPALAGLAVGLAAILVWALVTRHCIAKREEGRHGRP